MAAFTIYRLNETGQLNLFYNQEGKLDLKVILNEMKHKQVRSDETGRIISEGFTLPHLFQRSSGKTTLECFGFQTINLGTYVESRLQNEEILTTETSFDYLTKSKIILTEDSHLIVFSNNSNEEKGKSKMKTMVEDLGLEASLFKINHQLLKNIQEDTEIKWSEAKIEKINKEGDKTTKVSYEIDLADIVNRSTVADEYDGHGNLAHLKIQFPYTNIGEEETVTMNLYSNGHRISFETEELQGASVEDFTVSTLEFLLKYTDS
ncbi:MULTISPECIES: hypothetical protein [unclassified Exiguobacterium]|uniref:hypothetical protein n=1 Tax=Exiguobacterium TaxID=33986 RepID=UPI001BEAE0F0|nr:MULTISPECIES: hypothetical protein [unclassified Exiguobacterium]